MAGRGDTFAMNQSINQSLWERNPPISFWKEKKIAITKHSFIQMIILQIFPVSFCKV